jgi:hypothetical protein
MTQRTDDLPPETVNAEQQDADVQAQSVTDDAINRSTSVQGLDDSEKPSGGFDDVDEQDLVDHMKHMTTSGQIDMSAYAGEEAMDDLENKYGRDEAPDPQFADDDS